MAEKAMSVVIAELRREVERQIGPRLAPSREMILRTFDRAAAVVANKKLAQLRSEAGR